MDLRTNAQDLLNDWETYRHVHLSGSHKILYEVINVEMQKDAVQRFASHVKQGLFDDSCSPEDLEFRVTTLAKNLREFKDYVTLELLKHG